VIFDRAVINLIAGEASRSESIIETIINNAAANGREVNVIRITVLDDHNNLIINTQVSISLNNTRASIIGDVATQTDINGQVYISMANLKVETFDVGFTLSGLSISNESLPGLSTGKTSSVTFIPLDSDGDGVFDTIEIAENTDPFDINDFKNTDGDISPDAIEHDLDSDNDGIYDDTEDSGNDPYGDNDNDGIPDYLDADDKGDGTAAACIDVLAGIGVCDNGEPLDPVFDYDQDGIPNHADIDSDNDSLPDVVEGDNDSEFTPDTHPNYLDPDSDGDGVPDIIESGSSGIDTDSDGIDDSYDIDIIGGNDINGDGIDDAASALNSDDDDHGDYLDLDSDNDGIPDTLEATTSSDSDGDGIDDTYDINITGGNDRNNDGIDDAVIPLDTDGDGRPDYQDTDSDDDGLSDEIEGQSSGIDDDGDGIDNHFDSDNAQGTDDNNDGIVEDSLPNNDQDNSADYRDLDSDNDTIPDINESGEIDFNGDGLVDNYTLTSLPLPDADNDGIADYLEVDSDDDGTFDIEGTENGNFDSNNDGQVDVINDKDNDGIDDTVDTAVNTYGLKSIDTDGDGISDEFDPDDDNDGISDIFEGEGDTDKDGIPDRLDIDSDNDGISDYVEAQIPVFIGDSDGNGIDDVMDISFTGGLDVNNDGFDDAFEPVDTDADLIFDYLDLDSDNDGVTDNEETSNIPLTNEDTDGDGLDDAYDVDQTLGVDVNGDGSDDDAVPLIDTDGDGIFNFLEVDSDNDKIPDGLENEDYNNNGTVERLEAEGEVSTAVKGAGSFHIQLLILMGLLLIRRKMKA
ncbi:Ig-like domain-containing protein, partial [Colwellia sp. Bg11-28]|uniref:Ig-like domain-containing protein n=1 Tax=Colwellia sp. Bg11-28 TaxID=2058305 RepID=UPI000CC55D9B